MHRWLLSFFLVVWASFSHADALYLTDQQDWPTNAIDHIALFEDATGRLGVDAVSALPMDSAHGFKQARSHALQLGLSTSAWWLHLDLTNSGTAPLLLRYTLGPFNFENVDFYLKKNERWTRHPMGTAVPVSARFHKSRKPALPVELQAGEHQRILVRVHGSLPIQFSPKIFSETAYQASDKRTVLLDGILFGGLLALGWGALMVALVSRSRSFFLLGTLSSLVALYEASLRGYAKFYLWPDAPQWGAHSPLALGQTTLALTILLALSLAREQKITVPWRGYLVCLAAFQTGIALAAAVPGLHMVAARIAVFSTPVCAASFVLMAVLVFKQAAATRKLIVLITVFVSLHLGLRATEKLGLMPESLTGVFVDSVSTHPVVALLGLYLNLTLIAGWISYIAHQRQTAQAELAAWQEHEQHRLQKEVARQTDALNEALLYANEKNRQKTEILSYISHDLRAPLASIAGYTQLLSRSETPGQKPHIHAIERNVGYQLSLIDELLKYATTELKPLEIEPVHVRMANLMDDITQYAIALSRQQDNQFLCDSTPLPATVLVDGRRLQQILLNLLANACKFTHHGTISLTVEAQRSSDHWILAFTVADSGPGIDVPHQASVFNAFEQVRPENSGVGLGLFIAQNIVRNMGSELHLVSKSGEGSRFSFQIEVPVVNGTLIKWSVPSLNTDGMNRDDTAVTTALQEEDSLPVPPAHKRLELAVLARNGHLTDIEKWLHGMAKAYPDCDKFFVAVNAALQILDLEGIEALALSPA